MAACYRRGHRGCRRGLQRIARRIWRQRRLAGFAASGLPVTPKSVAHQAAKGAQLARPGGLARCGTNGRADAFNTSTKLLNLERLVWASKYCIGAAIDTTHILFINLENEYYRTNHKEGVVGVDVEVEVEVIRNLSDTLQTYKVRYKSVLIA